MSASWFLTCCVFCVFAENVSLIGYPDDSDSENEEGVLEKLACAMGHLVTG